MVIKSVNKDHADKLNILTIPRSGRTFPDDKHAYIYFVPDFNNLISNIRTYTYIYIYINGSVQFSNLKEFAACAGIRDWGRPVSVFKS